MNANQKRNVLFGAAGLALVGLGAALFVGLGHKQPQSWVRPPAAHIEYTTRAGDDVNKVAFTHGGMPTLMLAAFNDERLATGFQLHCGDDRIWPRPGRYYCNPRLNLARASTLKPEEKLRIPDSSALPDDIVRAVAKMGTNENVAILVDATNPYLKQRGLDAAVEWNLALSKQGKPLATIW
ncbi:MAG: hypothetical protein JWO84_264, partial [Parcubacteria group bacterium]|nr:hypothetical protein [Parcubacteria group bacterium]